MEVNVFSLFDLIYGKGGKGEGRVSFFFLETLFFVGLGVREGE